jgi:anti-sigma B factor antagonist
MDSNFERAQDTLIVKLSGDLIGGADAMKFATQLRDALADKPAAQLQLDTTDVGFVNSSGLGMLIAARQTALEHNAQFAVLHPSAQLRSLLAVTKLNDILGVTA